MLRNLKQSAANMPPKTLANLELDYATLSAISPGIILTASTAFGSHEDTGHRVGFDEVGQAMSGAVYISGIPDRPTKAMVPTVGEHTEEVVAEVGYDASWMQAMRKAGI